MDDHTPFNEPGRVRVLGGTLGTSVRTRRLSVPVAQTHKYSRADWDASLFSLFAEGADPAPCPECGHTGFFGPRFAEPNVRYRSCRFCGFWQEIGCLPEFHLPTVHGCEEWPKITKVEYLWWVNAGEDFYECPFCTERVDVPLCIVSAPSEDPEHPFRRIPQNKAQSVYQRLWNNWEFTAGRTIL